MPNINAEVKPSAFIELLDTLDEDGESYHLVRIGETASGTVELRLDVHDAPIASHAIILRPDGTWVFRSELPVL